jgi:hypothetical protein
MDISFMRKIIILLLLLSTSLAAETTLVQWNTIQQHYTLTLTAIQNENYLVYTATNGGEFIIDFLHKIITFNSGHNSRFFTLKNWSDEKSCIRFTTIEGAELTIKYFNNSFISTIVLAAQKYNFEN